MTTVSDFKVGDKVENSYRARGTVTKVDASVHVLFSEKGGTWDGVFTDKWLKKYDMLKKVAR